MADLFQGAALPDVNTTQTTTSTAPEWYSNYLSGLPAQLQTAATQGGAAGASGLQTQAYTNAPTAITAGQPYLQQGAEAVQNVAGTPTSSLIQDYLNPYTQDVVGEINRLGQQQFRETLAPGVTAGAAGSGQFGSKRGMQTYGNVARDVNANILGEQAKNLNLGFQNAVTAAQQQQKLGLDTGTAFGNLSTNAYNQGIGGLNALSTLGAQQQATEQARLNYPMLAESNIAKTIGGLNIPMSTTQTFKGPIPGAYQESPLMKIIGGTSGIAGFFANKTDSKGNIIPNSSLYGALKNIPGIGKYFTDNATENTGTNTNTGGLPDSGGSSANITDLSGNVIGQWNPATGNFENPNTGEIVNSADTSNLGNVDYNSGSDFWG